jgi:hypothetical protein
MPNPVSSGLLLVLSAAASFALGGRLWHGSNAFGTCVLDDGGALLCLGKPRRRLCPRSISRR